MESLALLIIGIGIGYVLSTGINDIDRELEKKRKGYIATGRYMEIREKYKA